MNEKFEKVEYDLIPYVSVFLNRIKFRSPHFHPALETGLVLEGQGEFIISGQILTLQAGDIVMLNQNQLHSIQSGDDGVLMLFVQFSLGIFKDVVPNVQSLSIDQALLEASEKPEEANEIRKLLIELAWQYQDQDLVGRLSLLSTFFALVAKLLTHFEHHFMSTAEEQNTVTYVNRINRLVTFVEENYRNRISLGDFAARENLTLSYMSRFVKENFGQNFQSYVTDYRFRHAKNLLVYENKNLLDVCYESGFSDPRFLAKAFRERLGMSPEEYRKSLETNRSQSPWHAESPDPETDEYRFNAEESLTLIRKYRSEQDS